MLRLLVTLNSIIAVPFIRRLLLLVTRGIIIFAVFCVCLVVAVPGVFVYLSYHWRRLVLDPVTRVIYGIIGVASSLVLRPPYSGSLVALGLIIASTCVVFRRPVPDDLEGNIIYQCHALNLHPTWHPDHSSSLNNLANALATRFQNTGQMVDLEEALAHHRDALELRPPGHPDRPGSLNNLANALNIRFQNTGQMTDLEEAIMHHRDALETRFTHKGQTVDLEEAITHHRDALELRPPGHPDRFMSLNNLANALQIRFENTGQMVDLEEAIREYHSERFKGGLMDVSKIGLNRRFDEFSKAAPEPLWKIQAFQHSFRFAPRM
ncbi:hypothetical protein FIBSPDRAFT_808230, partial [Athelia psychrophila]